MNRLSKTNLLLDGMIFAFIAERQGRVCTMIDVIIQDIKDVALFKLATLIMPEFSILAAERAFSHTLDLIIGYSGWSLTVLL